MRIKVGRSLCSHPRLAAFDISPSSADRLWRHFFAYLSAPTTPKACTDSVYTALCRSRQQCNVLAIVLQYFIRAFILEYKVSPLPAPLRRYTSHHLSRKIASDSTSHADLEPMKKPMRECPRHAQPSPPNLLTCGRKVCVMMAAMPQHGPLQRSENSS